MGVSQIKGTILGVPIIRIVVFWGLYWGPPILGNYYIGFPRSIGDCIQVWCRIRYIIKPPSTFWQSHSRPFASGTLRTVHEFSAASDVPLSSEGIGC